MGSRTAGMRNKLDIVDTIGIETQLGVILSNETKESQ